MDRLYGGIEAGGTKFVCAVGTGPDDLRACTRFPTTTPDETLGRAIDFFKCQPVPVIGVGIGCFGPLDLASGSPTYGSITTAPKTRWQGVNVAGRIGGVLGVPVALDTDVNAAALGEHRWGAVRDVDTFVYLTIGTGIGGGGMASGRLLRGLVHPEMGHLLIPHDGLRDPFVGVCPFHGDCLEGLASGPAIEARWGAPGEMLPADHPAWVLEAHYLALGLANLIAVLSPQRIVLGGGVMHQQHLYGLVRREVQALLAGYLTARELQERIDTYLVPPALGDRSGVLGAIALAQCEGQGAGL